MRDVLALIDTTNFDGASSYISSYPHMISFARGLPRIGESEVVALAHMVYGWMPTIVELHQGPGKATLIQAAELLELARSGVLLSESMLEELSGLVNNSMVGASKLLHFVAPDHYAIWDSKIYSFVHEKRPYNHRVNDAGLYLQYLHALRKIADKDDFYLFHKKINSKIGYPVSEMRAIELVIFQNSTTADA